MIRRITVVTTLLLGLSTMAQAGTKMQMNIVPTPADCFVIGTACLNVAAGCAIDNSECAGATMSEKSKIKIKSDLTLKAKIKDVTDVTGAKMTTGPAETASDNLVLKVRVSTCPVDTGAPPFCDDVTDVYLKVVLTDGDGSLDLDLSTVFPGVLSGNPFNILGVSLVVPGTGGFDCPNTNSPADILGRLNDPTCDTGIIRGVGGFTKD